MLKNYPHYYINYEGIQLLKFPLTNKPFLLTVFKSGVKFEFLIRIKKKSQKAIILGSGAYDAKSSLTPPIFQRHQWIPDLKGTLIFYNDPTLYLGQINIGWGHGTAERFYLKELSDILLVLLNKLNIDRKKVLCYGSSAGGFMSLMLSGLLKSTALVNNPQTIVHNYQERHVNEMFAAVHPNKTRQEIINQFTERLVVAEFYKKICYVPTIHYLQNVSCVRDVAYHLIPFVFELEKMDYPINVMLYLYSNVKEGHNPLNKEKSLKYINGLLNGL